MKQKPRSLVVDNLLILICLYTRLIKRYQPDIHTYIHTYIYRHHPHTHPARVEFLFGFFLNPGEYPSKQ